MRQQKDIEKCLKGEAMGNNFLIALCGRSGAGKSTVADRLKDLMQWNVVESYTTRAKREEGEKGHIFISEEEFDRIPEENMVVFTVFDGGRYCATAEQVENAELYIVDFPGIKELKQKYPGDKKIVVIYLDAPTEILIERMRRRGDSEEKIEKRVKNDDQMFCKGEADINLLIDARKPIDEVAQKIIDYVSKCAA